YDGGAGNTSLSGMVLVFYNGSNNRAYRVYDLDGLSTGSEGYFLAATSVVDGIADRVADNSGLIFAAASNNVQNGADGVALYTGLDADDFDTSGADATTPGDVDLSGDADLIDAVVYVTSDPDPELLGLLGITGGSIDENLDGNGADVSIGRVPDGNNPFNQSEGIWSRLDPPTPGFANQPSFELDLFFSPESVAENAGAGALEAVVSRDGDGVGPLVVSFSGNDPTELDFPAEVTIPDGEFELVFNVDVVDDGAADGTQTVTITASAPDFNAAVRSVDVTDDNDAPTLVINEIYAEVEPGEDPNNDGFQGDFVGDEFVEIVNISSATLDISSWTLSDNEGVRHVFPEPTVLGPDCAIVVFGGGGFSEGVREDFGNALVQKSSSGGLGLNDSGDSILIREGDIERAGSAYDDYDAEMGGDLTRMPELTGEFTPHVLVGAGPPFSPGYRGDNGAEFCTPSDSLSLAGAATFAENGGDAVEQFTLRRSGDTGSALEVQLGTSDASEARFQLTTVEIPAGMDSIQVAVDAVDDPFIDGEQTLELTADAIGFVSAFAEVVVTDGGGDSSYLLINEIDVDSNSGSDTAEFIELYDGGIGNTQLDGYAVVLINGANDEIYDVYDLDGRFTNAAGFFVIGAPGVPNVGMTDLPGSSGFLQNGAPDAVALFVGSAAEFPLGRPFIGTAIDAVVYGGTGGEGDTLGPSLGLGNERVSTDGVSDTISRLPNGGSNLDLSGFGSGIPTPGAGNLPEGGDTAYDLWAAGYPGLGSQLDDVDGDTLTTIMEYALGKNPLLPDLSGNPIGGMSGGQLLLTVDKGTEADADPNLTYIIEASTDLNTWSTDDTTVVPGPPGTLTVAYSGAAPRAHLRLRVVLR
ncbi:MAG: lamin tail domain-containing protein, partial [Verrucomicrobiales bacterium]